jgi:methionyl-tRNA formyltransferase
VITAPDKPAEEDYIQESAVKQYAKSKHIPVLQPIKLKDPIFIEELQSYQADLQIVIAFRMLPK